MDYFDDDFGLSPAEQLDLERQDQRDTAVLQALAARDWIHQSTDHWVRFPWPTLSELTGPLFPGSYALISGYTGGGKSTFLQNCIDCWAATGTRIWYVPLEQPGKIMRAMWAGMATGHDPRTVVLNEWHKLPLGAREMVAKHTEWQQVMPMVEQVHFEEAPTVDARQLDAMMDRAAKLQYQVMVIDHFQRLEGATGYAESVKLARVLKEGAKRTGLTVLVANQLKKPQGTDPLRPYRPPEIEDSKGAGAIVEEADLALGVYRPLQEMSKADRALILAHQKSPADFLKAGWTALKMTKHRFGSNAGKIIELRWQAGRILDPANDTLSAMEDKYDL